MEYEARKREQMELERLEREKKEKAEKMSQEAEDAEKYKRREGAEDDGLDEAGRLAIEKAKVS